jgi:hypothetical protein
MFYRLRNYLNYAYFCCRTRGIHGTADAVLPGCCRIRTVEVRRAPVRCGEVNSAYSLI